MEENKIKREKLNTLQEKDLLIGLIISDEFCREICPVLIPKYLEIDYSRIVATWIKKYFDNFGEAPKKEIIKLYRDNCEEITDEALQDNILSFIENINDKYSETSFNAQFAIERSIQYLKYRSVVNFKEDLDASLVNWDTQKAESLITKYRKVEKSSGDKVSIFDDSETILTALTEEKDKLFSLEGPFGSLLGDVNREDFIAFLAPMKAGKTFQLTDIGIEAVKRGLKVVFFSLEMSRNSMIKRIWKSFSGQVTEDIDIEVPYFEEQADGKYKVVKRTVHKKASSVLDIEKKQKQYKKMFRGSSFLLYNEPAYSLTIEKLENKLDDLAFDGFYPDVIIIDYADIMMPSEKGEYRNQLDSIWKRLRATAQARKCAVFTASQTNRSGLNGPVGAETVAEDIRKVAHVTSMVSISKPKECKDMRVAIYEQLATREGSPIVKRVVATQNLAIGRTVMDSKWENEVIMKDFEKKNTLMEEEIKKKNWKN